MKMSILIDLAVKPMRFLQLLAPMFLGIISENTRIRTVMTADAMPTAELPYILPTSAPIAEAPIVLAMVLRIRMAESGRSVSLLYSLRRMAGL